MSKIIQADVVFTNIGNPIKNGGLKVDENGTILDVFSQKEMLDKTADEIKDKYSCSNLNSKSVSFPTKSP